MTDTQAELRDAYLKILKGAFNIGWAQGEKEMGRLSRGGESYRDGGKVKELLDADAEKLIALLPPAPAVDEVLKRLTDHAQYLEREFYGQDYVEHGPSRVITEALAALGEGGV